MPGLASLSRSLQTKLSERKSPVIITELDEKGKPVQNGSTHMSFQYFPETITDTKAVGYQTKDIPGGSLPLYQWMHSGERIISFTSVFTADVDLLQDTQLFTKLASKGHIRRNVDIRSALVWLRRFMLPSYAVGASGGVGVPLARSPRKLLLWIPNSGIGLLGGDTTNAVMAAEGDLHTAAAAAFAGTVIAGTVTDEVLCVMTQCDVTYEAFFPSGLPRIASVQLTFAQVAQRGGLISFPSVTPKLDNLVEKGNETLNPYPIKVTFQ